MFKCLSILQEDSKIFCLKRKVLKSESHSLQARTIKTHPWRTPLEDDLKTTSM